MQASLLAAVVSCSGKKKMILSCDWNSSLLVDSLAKLGIVADLGVVSSYQKTLLQAEIVADSGVVSGYQKIIFEICHFSRLVNSPKGGIWA